MKWSQASTQHHNFYVENLSKSKRKNHRTSVHQKKNSSLVNKKWVQESLQTSIWWYNSPRSIKHQQRYNEDEKGLKSPKTAGLFGNDFRQCDRQNPISTVQNTSLYLGNLQLKFQLNPTTNAFLIEIFLKQDKWKMFLPRQCSLLYSVSWCFYAPSTSDVLHIFFYFFSDHTLGLSEE